MQRSSWRLVTSGKPSVSSPCPVPPRFTIPLAYRRYRRLHCCTASVVPHTHACMHPTTCSMHYAACSMPHTPLCASPLPYLPITPTCKDASNPQIPFLLHQTVPCNAFSRAPPWQMQIQMQIQAPITNRMPCRCTRTCQPSCGPRPRPWPRNSASYMRPSTTLLLWRHHLPRESLRGRTTRGRVLVWCVGGWLLYPGLEG